MKPNNRRAFTLVELLVVIGIIAVLIGVLLPVLSRVQSRGRDVKCQANLRQLLIALRGYAEENRGMYPYGVHWMVTVKPIPEAQSFSDVEQVGSNQGNFVSWASTVTKWMRRGQSRSHFDNDDTNFSEALVCPEAITVYPHPLSYAVNMIVCVSPYDELRVGPRPNAQVKPANQSRMKDTVLLWDTACYAHEENSVGYLLGVDIDAQRFWDGAAFPQYRYFSQNDPFSQFPGAYGNNDPVKLTPPGFSTPFRNIDPPNPNPNNGPGIPYQGNLRFRHQNNTACNAGFADGRVEQFIAKMNSDKTIKSHTALRRYFMTKYPTGVIPDPNTPS